MMTDSPEAAQTPPKRQFPGREAVTRRRAWVVTMDGRKHDRGSFWFRAVTQQMLGLFYYTYHMH